MSRRLFIHFFKSKWGVFRTAATDKYLVKVSMPHESQTSFDDQIADRFPGCNIERGGPVNKLAEREIKDYLKGSRRKFTVKFNIYASPFQKKVLKYVARIPFGQVKSYGEIAELVGCPRAARAVGTANARNCLPLIIPCHRVVSSNGIGGYGGGPELKRKLLRHEGVTDF